MKADVYLNLHKDAVSVRSRETENYGKVVAHKPKVHIADATFVVQPAGREKCRENETKNVHAFVRGEWTEAEKVLYGEPVTYNPYKYDTFVQAENEEPVEGADLVMVSSSGNISAKGLY